jgi:hypothetical protein
MAVHVGSHFGSHPAPPRTRLLPVEQNIEFRKGEQGTPVRADRDASTSASLVAALLVPFANATARIARVPRSALRSASLGEVVISRAMPRDRIKQASGPPEWPLCVAQVPPELGHEPSAHPQDRGRLALDRGHHHCLAAHPDPLSTQLTSKGPSRRPGKQPRGPGPARQPAHRHPPRTKIKITITFRRATPRQR